MSGSSEDFLDEDFLDEDFLDEDFLEKAQFANLADELADDFVGPTF
jgi:hypothetical protein